MESTVKELENRIEWRNEREQLHRLDGPAVEYSDGSKQWWVNGLRHRENGPAIEHSYGTKKWFINGLCHREDGPAVEWYDGDKGWFLNGVMYTEEEIIRIKLNRLING